MCQFFLALLHSENVALVYASMSLAVSPSHAVRRLLQRNTRNEQPSPATNLVIEVLVLAIVNSVDRRDQVAARARRFLSGKGFVHACELAGFETAWLTEQIATLQAHFATCGRSAYCPARTRRASARSCQECDDPHYALGMCFRCYRQRWRDRRKVHSAAAS
jgi:hypothetical protein